MSPFAVETARARTVLRDWSEKPIRERTRPLRRFRELLVERCAEFCEAAREVGRSADELVATDLLPTAAAAKWLAQYAGSVLRPRRASRPPLWLLGARDVTFRRPHGVVAVVGTWNYPIFLNAVPLLQAAVAGNAVLWKPSERAPRSAEVLHRTLIEAGFPNDLFHRLPEHRDNGALLAEADIDFLHFTGSDAVGSGLARRLGERLVPSVLELSGCDAAFVFRMPTSPLQRAAFGTPRRSTADGLAWPPAARSCMPIVSVYSLASCASSPRRGLRMRS
jgi:acyl-CoA reductase-like NAD-dependent aldehyde dehydrogenase